LQRELLDYDSAGKPRVGVVVVRISASLIENVYEAVVIAQGLLGLEYRYGII